MGRGEAAAVSPNREHSLLFSDKILDTESPGPGAVRVRIPYPLPIGAGMRNGGLSFDGEIFDDEVLREGNWIFVEGFGRLSTKIDLAVIGTPTDLRLFLEFTDDPNDNTQSGRYSQDFWTSLYYTTAQIGTGLEEWLTAPVCAKWARISGIAIGAGPNGSNDFILSALIKPIGV